MSKCPTKGEKMTLDIRIIHVQENTLSNELPSNLVNPKHKQVAIAKTLAFASALVNAPADHMINKYPVRIFNIEP
jgi:hypothetical protein